VLAMSDALAAGLLMEAAARGIEVPRRLSVVGFDDVPMASSTNPPLTTVHQPTEEKGELAARALLDALAAGGEGGTRGAGGEGAPTRTVLPSELVVRGSTGPPG
jgi:DNA-binding LacI/PurR family transcriptional regulator